MPFASDERFVLLGDTGGAWTEVQRIRLDGFDTTEAVETVRAFMREAGDKVASWWLSEHSTPADVEERLLAAGLQIIEDDYLNDGMLLTVPPPPGPAGVVASRIDTLDDFVTVIELQCDVFGVAPELRRSREVLAEVWERRHGGDDAAAYATWIDGQIVAAAWAHFSPRGVLLSGGATAPSARGRGAYRALVRARWDAAVTRGTPALAVHAGAMSAPILQKLGFATVCRFRRLEGVLSET